MYQFRADQFLPIPIEQAWAFFSAAQNLSKITPPEMKFNVLTQLKDEEIYNRMLIDYTVRPLFGIPLHWQTEICKVERPTMFTDQQLKGPFKIWHFKAKKFANFVVILKSFFINSNFKINYLT